MAKYRILVVDDDPDILDLLEYNLEREGFKVKVVNDSSFAIEACNSFEPDLIILDIMMPLMNGIEVCKRVRTIEKFKDTHIFFLTARSESYYQEAALDTGGDDYIQKIIGLRSLTNKIKTVLNKKLVIRKRVQEIILGELSINRRTHVAKFKNHVLSLSIPEFELLYFFAQNPGIVITSENLLSNVWGSETFLFGSPVDSYIDLLIRKLGGQWLYKLSEDKYTMLTK